MPQFTSRWSIPFLTIIERPSIHGITGQMAAAIENAVNSVQDYAVAARAVADNAIASVSQFNSAPAGRMRMQDGGQAIASNANVGQVLQLSASQNPMTSGMRQGGQNTRMFAPRAGVYQVAFAGGFEPPAGTPQGIRAFEVRVNAGANGTGGYRAGERQIKSVAGTDGRVQIAYTFLVVLAQGDAVELFGIQSQTAGVTVSQQTELSLNWLRPTP